MWTRSSTWLSVIICSQLFSCNKDLQETILPEDVVAHLRGLLPDVKVKRNNRLEWDAALVNTPLQNYDALRTSLGANGTVVFNDETTLDVKENSLIIILERTGDKSHTSNVVALPEGSLNGEFPLGDSKHRELQIRTPRAWIRVNNQDQPKEIKKIHFQIKIDKKKGIDITSENGNLTVFGKNISREVTPEHTLTLPPPEESEKQNLEENNAKEYNPDDFKSPPLLPEAAFQKFDTEIDSAMDEAKTEPEVEQKIEPVTEPETKTTQKQLLPFEIISPVKGQKVEGEQINIRGRASADVQVFLNGKEIKPTSSNGGFNTKIELKRGLNFLTFQVVNKETQSVSHQILELVRIK